MKVRKILLALLSLYLGNVMAVYAEEASTPEPDAVSTPSLIDNSQNVRKKGERRKTRDGELPKQTGKSGSLVSATEPSESSTTTGNSSANAQPSSSTSDSSLNPTLAYSDALIETAGPLLGRKYVYGSKGPNTFDCSGFTSYVYREATGIKLAPNSAGQSKGGYAVSNSDLRPGDLVFFTGQNASTRTVAHVGIIIQTDGPNDFWFMHASSSQGITVDHITQSAYFKVRYLWARRMF